MYLLTLYLHYQTYNNIYIYYKTQLYINNNYYFIELFIFVKIKAYITWLCFSEENVRDIALRFCLEEEQRRKTNPNETHERSIIIVGSKRVVCSILKILNNINTDYISIFMRKKYIFLG